MEDESGLIKPKKVDKFKIIKIIFLLIFAFLYDISPIDIIPDFLIGIGWIDDLILTGFSFYYTYKKIKG